MIPLLIYTLFDAFSILIIDLIKGYLLEFIDQMSNHFAIDPDFIREIPKLVVLNFQVLKITRNID